MAGDEISDLNLVYWLKEAGYRYSCFISWPHQGGPDMEKTVRSLKKLLNNALLPHKFPEEIFADFAGIGTGHQWEATISKALCESIAMVAVCAPAYYDSEYCAREWAGMELLSRQRLPPPETNILPLIWAKPGGSLPEEVSELEHRDLTQPLLRTSDLERTASFRRRVAEIADDVRRIARSLEKNRLSTESCDEFVLPAPAFAKYKRAAELYPFGRIRAI